MTTTYMGGRRGPPEGGERPLRGLPGGRARPRPTPPGTVQPDDAGQPGQQSPEDGDRPRERVSGEVVRPLQPLRVLPGGAGQRLRLLPGGAEAPLELPSRDGHAPEGDLQADDSPDGHPRPAPSRRGAAPRRRWVAGVLALALLTGLAVTGRVVAERPKAGPATTTPATIAAPPPPTPVQPSPVVATIGIGGFSYGMAAGAGALWVAGSDHVTRIDPATNSVVARIPVGATGSGPADVAFGGGAVWVPVAVPGAVFAIDPATNKVTARISLGGPLRGPISVSATRGAVWVACCGETGAAASDAGGTLFRIDPLRERVVAEIALPANPVAVAADPSAAWVATAGGRVLQVSARRNRVVGGVDAGGTLGFSQTLAVGAGALWLADPFDEQVVRIDPKTRRVVARIPAGAATTLAVARDAVWVISSLGLLRVDPATDQVVATASDPDLRRARLVATTAGAVWTAAWNSVARIDPDLIAP